MSGETEVSPGGKWKLNADSRYLTILRYEKREREKNIPLFLRIKKIEDVAAKSANHINSTVTCDKHSHS